MNIKQILLCALFVLLTIFQTHATAVTITNGDFTTGTGTNVVATGWSFSNATKPATYKYSTVAKGTGPYIAGTQQHYQIYSGSAYTSTFNQTITNLAAGNYTVSVKAVLTGAGGTFSVYAGTTKTTISSTTGATYSATTTVAANGSLTFGIDMATITGTIDFDDFTVDYTPSPVIVKSISSNTFGSYEPFKTFTVTGSNLTTGLSITTPSGITLSGANVTGTAPNYSIALANANAINTITATWDGTTAVTSQNIAFSSTGATTQNIAVNSDNTAQFIPTNGQYYYLIQGPTSTLNANKVLGSNSGTPALMTALANENTQWFTFEAVPSTTNQYYIKNANGNYLNFTSGTSVAYGTQNGDYSIWRIKGTTTSGIRLINKQDNTYLNSTAITAGSATSVGGTNTATNGAYTMVANTSLYQNHLIDGGFENCAADGAPLGEWVNYSVLNTPGARDYGTGKSRVRSGATYASGGNMAFGLRFLTAGDEYTIISTTATGLTPGQPYSLDFKYKIANGTETSAPVDGSTFNVYASDTQNGALSTALGGATNYISTTTPTVALASQTANGYASQRLSFVADQSTCYLVFSKNDNTKNFIAWIDDIVLTEADVTSSSLGGITLQAGGINPSFNSATTSYTVNAPADVTSVSVNGTATSPAIISSGNGNSVSAGNSVTLICTSYDNNHTTNYTFNWGGNYTLADWSAQGNTSSSIASLPSTYGWKCTNIGTPNTVVNTWNNFGTQANCRYVDKNTGGGYSYNNVEWTGRLLFIRWDGYGGNNGTSVYSYPIYLAAGTTYQINGKAAWNSVATAPTLTFKVNTANDNSGTDYATANVITGASGVLVNADITNISVPSSGIYYLTITANTASLCAISDLILNTRTTQTFSGSVDNTWSNVSNWSSRIPLAGDNVTLSGGSLTIDQNAFAGSISVASGAKLDVASGKSLKATSITLHSNATGTATFVNNGTATITSAIVNQYLPVGGRNWYISSPIAGGIVPTGSTYLSYDEPTAQWLTNTTGTALNVGKGYIAQPTDTLTMEYTGALNDGAITVNLSRTYGVTKSGFNLVGNPYPSYLNWDAVTKSNVESTIWYRTKVSGVYKFGTYNATSQIGANVGANDTDLKDIVTGNIPPFQAFWVRVKPAVLAHDTIGAIVFGNTMRAHKATQSQGDGQTYNDALLRVRSGSNLAQKVLRLEVSNGINSDEAIILFNANASNSLDDYDSPKMTNANAAVPEIYTTIGTENMVINGLNSIETINAIPLGFTTGQSNTFTISASKITNFDGVNIYLRDNLAETETELIDGNTYSFTSDATNTTSRFMVIFKSPVDVTGVNKAVLTNVHVYGKQGQIVINSSESFSDNDKLSIYNSIGQKLISVNLMNLTTLLKKNFAPGVYIVELNVNGEKRTDKVVVK